MPLLTATSAFGSQRRCWSSPQHCLCTLLHLNTFLKLHTVEQKMLCLWCTAGSECMETFKVLTHCETSLHKKFTSTHMMSNTRNIELFRQHYIAAAYRYTSHVAWSVCMSASLCVLEHQCTLQKLLNRSRHRWGQTHAGPKNHTSDGNAHQRHLANMNKQCV